MIFEEIEFHNVVELEPAAGGGVALRRIPASVRGALSPLGRMVAADAAGCEIRFVTAVESFRLALSILSSCLEKLERQVPDLTVFKGDFIHSHHRLEPGKIHQIQILDLGAAVKKSFEALTPEIQTAGCFSHSVWRFVLGRHPVVFHELDTYGVAVRPPDASEKPRKTMLCYGSSITHGASASSTHLSYVAQAARHLNVDVLNQGLAGACLCEPEMADDLAAREDWDLITLELGVNMRDRFSPEEFKVRSSALVKKIIAHHPGKPVVLITIYPNADSVACPANELQKTQRAYDEILRALVADLKHPNLHLTEGAELLTRFGNLSADLLHPGDYGHAEMGCRLATRLAGWLE